MIAVKQLSSKSKQGNREFINEIGMISALQHPNLVKLFGCCVEGNQLLVVYEYMENNCLARALFGKHVNISFLCECGQCNCVIAISICLFNGFLLNYYYMIMKQELAFLV